MEDRLIEDRYVMTIPAVASLSNNARIYAEHAVAHATASYITPVCESDYIYKGCIDMKIESEVRRIVSEELDRRFEKLRNALAPIMSEEEIDELLK